MSEPAPPKKHALRVPKWIDKVLLAIGLGLLVYVVSRYPFGEVSGAISAMWPRVALTPLIALSWFGCSTTLLYLLLDRRAPWRRILWIRLVGDSYNSLLPLGGFGGEPFKVRRLCALLDPATVMVALIRDKIIDNAMGFLVSAAGVTIGLGFGGYEIPTAARLALIIYAIAAAVLGVLGMALVMTRVTGKLGGWIAKALGDTAPEKIETLPVGRLARIAVWALCARVLGLCEIGTLLWILGMPHDVATVAFVDSFLNAAGYIGFFIPQGLGVFEKASDYVFGVIGGGGPAGVAFALARRGRMLAIGLFGVSLHLVPLALKNLRRLK